MKSILVMVVPLSYAAFEQPSKKALSREQVIGYLSGEGMSLALPAELNGYPGRRHVLDNAKAPAHH